MKFSKLCIAVLTVATIVSSYQLNAMESAPEVQTIDNSIDTIVMKIYPTVTFEVSAANRPTVDTMLVSLMGNFSKNQVQLISTEDCKIVPKFLDLFLKNGSKESVSPESLEQYLMSGYSNIYPLSWHRRFTLMSDDTQLRLVECYSSGEECAQIDVPEDITKKILRYLTGDLLAYISDCGHFAREVRFSFNNYFSLTDIAKGYEHHIEELKQEEDVHSGDVIVCYDTCYNAYGKIKRVKHFAIALGNRKYLSKYGIGGPLMVSNLQSMFNFWCTKHIGKLSQEATENPRVWAMPNL